MRAVTLPRHYWWSFGRPPPVQQQCVELPAAPAKEKKPCTPAISEDKFWEPGKAQFFGIILPNRYQTLLFAITCILLALPVFLFDESGRGMFHGFITLASLVAFGTFCWIIGMLLASTAADPPSDQRNRRPIDCPPK